MTVLEEILRWSQDRPDWQRDALRRLVLDGEFTEEDISVLTEICKSAHGLTNPQETLPLAHDHVPDSVAGAEPVSLDSIFHSHGVNALAKDQTLNFGPNLTVVYGDNGAGKTGYIRILKSACRARGREPILGNVVSGTAPPTPAIAIRYRVGQEPDLHEWTGGNEDTLVSRVSVFDTQSAAVYLTEKTDVAFRPFGLDLFDKLVRVTKEVRAKLVSEQNALQSSDLGVLAAQIPKDTEVARMLARISSLTAPETVQSLATLSAEEEAQIGLLEKSLLDLQANDPATLVRQLSLLAGRLQKLLTHLRAIEASLSEEAVSAVFSARTEGRRKNEEAKRLREATFQAGLLAGTGSDAWSALWEAARQFSIEHAYPSKKFPATSDDCRCVLCQQDLGVPASKRLNQLESFVASTTEQELRQIRETFAHQRQVFAELQVINGEVEETLKEIGIEQANQAEAITVALGVNENRRAAVISALVEDRDLGDGCPDLTVVSQITEALGQQVAARIATLRGSASREARQRMTAEIQELRARKLLAEHAQTVLEEIDRKKKYAAYGVCIEETNTRAITQKSTAVTKSAVSTKLKQSFQEELSQLDFRDIEVELRESGGSEGVFYHQLVLTRAPKVDLPVVVSEGEQRCLSIAAFFAELSTANDLSGIVFDDPVSSLDYRWRQGVARRLVDESQSRQVIVFTHDVVFLLLLKQFAKELGVEAHDQHVRNFPQGAGICTNELPWVALRVRDKIGHLRNACQRASALTRNGEMEAYEARATYLYGLLREAWERAIEEVLLAGVVERFRPGIQTQQVACIADITPEDCGTVETAMTKCSALLPGHDQAAAARAPVPAPDELLADIEALDTWVKSIRKRR